MSRYKTPLRYPGGKQRLAPFILEVMSANDLIGGDYAEPYAGGAGVAMELLLSGQVARVHLNDSSRAVHFFWYAILNQTEDFCRRIASASLTVEEWRRQREILSRPSEFCAIDLGFSLFFLNRCNRSGIPSGGLIGGVNQTGAWKMDARFSRNELITRIEAIASKRKSITLKNWDAERFILEHVSTLPRKSLVYCDPPYFKKADRLYLNHYKAGDHERIAKVIQCKIRHPWVVSYDCAPEIMEFYSKRRSFVYDLQYNAGRVYKGKEIFVFSDKIQLPVQSIVPAVHVALAQAF
jgi:DNA adenine methylase